MRHRSVIVACKEEGYPPIMAATLQRLITPIGWHCWGQMFPVSAPDGNLRSNVREKILRRLMDTAKQYGASILEIDGIRWHRSGGRGEHWLR